MNPYQVMKVSLKPVNFIVEYLKVECIGSVLEAEDGATEIREFEQPRQRRHKERQKNCIFDDEKQQFCTLCTSNFHFCTFCRRYRSFDEVE